MKLIKIRPVQGKRIPHPHDPKNPRKAMVRAEGETVVYSTYWRRRLDQGDVELVPDIKPEQPKNNNKDGV